MTATIAVFGICQQQQPQKQQPQAPDKGLLIIGFWFNRSTVVGFCLIRSYGIFKNIFSYFLNTF